MMTRVLIGLIVVVFGVVVFSCRDGAGPSDGAANPPGVTAEGPPLAGAAATPATGGRPPHVAPLDWATAAGREFNQRFQRRLRNVLRTEGLAPAAAVCGTEVEDMLRDVGNTFDVRIGRASLPTHAWRPGHEPNEWQRDALADFQRAVAAGADPQRQVRVVDRDEDLPADVELRLMHGVRLEAMCTVCHGTAPHADAVAAMQERYPAHVAGGLAQDSLRGLLWVEVPVR